jgi:hypothetical protein|tara:strand:- start:11183 stop:12016 length:834 start_codon:yes stop_codon:yes gene_type:complete
MKKKALTFLIVIVVIFIILGIIYFSLVSSKTVTAQLNVESGNVLVNDLSVSGHVFLDEGDIVETSGNGRATIILYETLVVNLEPDTKININDLRKSHPQLTQEKGESWNTLAKIVGIEEYTIKSGNSVASIRGTSFIITSEKIAVLEGEVGYEIESQNYLVSKGRAVEKIDGKINERELNDEEIRKALEVKKRTMKQLKVLRERELEKHPKIVNTIKSKYDLTDEDIRNAFNDADEEILDIEEIERKSPVNIESVRKVSEITKEIIKIKQEILATSR